jgi:hypothetical protein
VTLGNSVLSRQVQTGVSEIRFFSRDERKQDDMRRRHWPDARIKFYVSDVREQSLKDAMGVWTSCFTPPRPNKYDPEKGARWSPVSRCGLLYNRELTRPFARRAPRRSR